MKVFIFFIFFLLSAILKAQVAENIKLENKQIIFEKIYPLDSLSAEKVQKLLILNIPKVQDLTNFSKTDEIIIAKISNATIDYQRYGGKWANTSAALNFPFFCDIAIVWKDQKYRVTISNMHFAGDPFGILKVSETFTSNKGSQLDSSKIGKRALHYIDSYLSDLFKISTAQNDNW